MVNPTFSKYKAFIYFYFLKMEDFIRAANSNSVRGSGLIY